MIKDVMQFVDGVKREFAKVIWPGKQELFGATVVVLVIVVFFSVYLGAVDLGFRTLAEKIFTLKRGLVN